MASPVSPEKITEVHDWMKLGVILLAIAMLGVAVTTWLAGWPPIPDAMLGVAVVVCSNTLGQLARARAISSHILAMEANIRTKVQAERRALEKATKTTAIAMTAEISELRIAVDHLRARIDSGDTFFSSLERRLGADRSS